MPTHFQAAIDAYETYKFYPDAAAALGITESAFRCRLHRARKRGLTPTPPFVPAPRAGAPMASEADLLQALRDTRTVIKPRISVSMGSRPAKPAAPASPANNRILLISDLHCPYQHKDALAFLAALKAKYDPDRVVNLGDELDYHAMSFHDSDPDLASAGAELQKGREVLWELEKMFPKMDLVDSNHGSMAYRKAKANGMPRHLILNYRDAVFGERRADGAIVRPAGRGDGWVWHPSLDIVLPTGNNLHVIHGGSKNTIANVKQYGCCFAQGHHHGSFELVYNGTPKALNWGGSFGCLIDDASYAFAYNKLTSARPVIGCGIVIDGQPKLLPMVLAKGGRWSGYVP
jgi:hypothetical protein